MPPDVPQPVRLTVLNPALDVPTFTASRLSRPHPGSQSRNYAGQKWPINFAETQRSVDETSRDLLHAANQRHGTHGFTSLPKEGALRIFSP
jgi:hypothetical protein